MPDITMCTDKECPKHEECYRFKAIPDSEWQSYFSESPRLLNEDCDYFWEMPYGKYDKNRKCNL